jgi:type III restriction enzyme
MSKQDAIPIQPVENPILCPPYTEPTAHWVYDTKTGIPTQFPDRRPASYWFKTERTATGQMGLFAEEERDDLPLVNALRLDVRAWRKSHWENASEITKTLLRHWWREDRARRLFFCQLEAVETIIYLQEIVARGIKPRRTPEVSVDDYRALARGQAVRPEEWNPKVAQKPRLADLPAGDGAKPLLRYACKMATGSGKTVLMAMLVAWTFCNRGRVPGDPRFPRRAVIVCPNLTIKERLQVLRPGDPDNYYDRFDLVPTPLRPELAKGKVLVTNWHWFGEASEKSEGARSYVVVNKGKESPEAFARNRLGDLWDEEPLLVLNDEGHHAYRPAPLDESEAAKLTAQQRADREEATVWISGIDRLNEACGVGLCVDLSATPFYIGGSGYVEGSPFPWIVSDFGLVDAIESGITKIPRLPAIDNTGRPDPKYFKLWEHITRDLQPGEKLPGGKPKPEVVWRKAEDALQTLAGQWKVEFERKLAARPGQEREPPVMILVCDNTQIAEHFHTQISGETILEADEVEEEDGDENGGARRKKTRTTKVHGKGQVFPELLSNTKGNEVTLRIDTNLLAVAESEDPNATRKEAAEELRRIVSTVGKPGQPGEKVRCVVSVNMLSEGWDANNVTHILGLRAFGSQLLCEQVVGRGLRRMDYTPDPETKLLTAEYVDVFGVPFSLIPFKGRQPKGPPPPPVERNEVMALPERAAFEIRFPVVEGYVVALEKNLVRCNVAKTEPMRINPWTVPVATFVRPQVGIQTGHVSAHGGFGFERMDRREFYRATHPQTIRFEIAREIVRMLTETAVPGKEGLRKKARSQLFPQVLRVVEEYVATKVDYNGQHPCELGLDEYAQRVRDMLVAAIEPDEQQGESPLLPRLNRYKPVGSTANVHFKTVKPVQATRKSHINFVACDTGTWEQAAMFQLEASPHVISYARNERMEFNIPYEFHDIAHVYEPDFLVRLTSGVTLILEVKGQFRDETEMKHQAAQRWLSAVNRWGRLGRWSFLVCSDPQKLAKALAEAAASKDGPRGLIGIQCQEYAER